MSNKKRKASESQLNIDLPHDLSALLEEFCSTTRMKRKATVELALRRFLNERRLEVQ